MCEADYRACISQSMSSNYLCLSKDFKGPTIGSSKQSWGSKACSKLCGVFKCKIKSSSIFLYSWWKSRVQGQNKVKSRLYASPFFSLSLSQLIVKHALVWKCKGNVSRKFSKFIIAQKIYPRTVYVFCISSVKKPTPYPATFWKESLNMLFFIR